MPTPTEEFLCRTKEISGVSYYVEIFDDKGQRRISGSCNTRAQAEHQVNSIKEKLPMYTGKITECPWTHKVCVECGEEIEVW